MKRVAALITAAGYGRRYGPQRKLHALLDGRPVLAWTLDLLDDLPLAARVLVAAPDDDRAADLAKAHACAVVTNPDPARGLGSSIACGVSALPEALDGVLVLLGDMPRLQPATCMALLGCFESLGEDAIVAPVHAGRRGHPVLFGMGHRAALAALDGDQGARALLGASSLTTLEVDDPGTLIDIDTPADLAAADRLPR